MRKLFFLLTVLCIHTSSIFADNNPDWGIRIGYSPKTEDVWGFGVAFRPDDSRWFHQLEIYPIQNRASSIVTEASNAGLLFRTNFILNKPKRFIQFFTGAELYGYQYSRKITGSVNLNTDQVVQLMALAGTNLRLGKRINLNLAIPLIGIEYIRSEDFLGTTDHTTPYFVGFYGAFFPKFGLDIGIF